MSTPPLPPTLVERPYDAQRGVPVPFVHEYDDGTYDLARLNPRRVVQCALSRVCAMCDQSLDYPLAFLGDDDAVASGVFAYPPSHRACAEAALRLYGGEAGWCLGPRPRLLVTGSFTVERPSRRGDPTLFRPAAGG
jgi:hypothetical protein